MKKIDETRNYLLEEVKHNELISDKYEKLGRTLNYFEDFFIFVSAISGCVSTSALASLVPVGITSSVAGLKTSAINAGIKKYNSIIKKKKKA